MEYLLPGEPEQIKVVQEHLKLDKLHVAANLVISPLKSLRQEDCELRLAWST